MKAKTWTLKKNAMKPWAAFTTSSVKRNRIFLEKIDLRDLFRVFVVEPQQLFERIRMQSSAFLISAFHERFERDEILNQNANIPVYNYYTRKVPFGSKQDIMEELRLLNITRESLFPGLDEAAKAVRQRYSEE